MIVKDIRKFRTFYKEKVRNLADSNRNEHFIGHSYNEDGVIKYGFFEIFHADKRDINRFITHFLDMAQDWQAVYEFLQNAYDANSNTFALFFDEEYLLAFNNGEQFTFEGIRSILNIGQSTKESKSNIGKFGVGFKISHRLIGEGNGKNELNELNGPILFSWNKYSDLYDLVKTNAINDIRIGETKFENNDGNYFCQDDNPWLFKILLTNFPCGINDEIINLKYQQISDVFSNNEYLRFKEYVNDKIVKNDVFSDESLSKGTIIFLKLGKGKSERLKENHINKGISYSLNVLNNLRETHSQHKLDKIYYNDIKNPFLPEEITVKKIYVENTEPDYLELTSNFGQDEKPDRIEFIYGYSKDITNTSIKGYPNFYLYFPLSDESHKYNFILHCNIFHNLSQRTNLDDGERNRKILRFFSRLLIDIMNKCKIENQDEYARLYAAILTSEWTPLTNKTWVFDNLLKPLMDYIKNNIPTSSGTYEGKGKVRIKGTLLDILPANFGVNDYGWFRYEDSDLIKEARNSYKLGLTIAGIQELISSSTDITKINEWIKTHQSQVNDIISEISKFHIKGKERYANGLSIQTSLSKNLNDLECFLFADGKFNSINQAKNNKTLLFLTTGCDELFYVFRELGINVCIIDDKLQNLLYYLKEELNYLKDKNNILTSMADGLGSDGGCLQYASLEKLLSFYNNMSAPICSKIIIEPKEGMFRLSKATNKSQCYVPEEKRILFDYIRRQYSDKFILLDKNIYNQISNKTGIMGLDIIYEVLLKDKTDDPRLIDVVIESDSHDFQRNYLKKLDKLILVEDTVYKKDSDEHKILELVETIKDEAFRDKIIIKTKGDIIVALKDISYSNNVTFSDTQQNTNKKYELSLSKILPKYSNTTELVEKIIECFADYNAYNLRRMIFKVEEQKPKDEIVQEINNVLENEEQLAFIMLLYKYYPKHVPLDSNYTIFKGQQHIALEKTTYYLNSFPYVNESQILDDRYQALKEVLRLDNNNPYFNADDYIMALSPYFANDTFCIRLDVKDDIKYSITDSKSFFLSLYNIYANIKDQPAKIVFQQQGIKEQEYKTKSPNDIFGFIPEQIIYDREYSIEEERIPDWIQEWLNEGDYQNKKKYLKALGVQTEESDLVQLRKYLVGKITIPTTEDVIKTLANKKLSYIINTLVWLASQEGDAIHITEKTEKYNLLKIIYSIVGSQEERPIVVIKKITQDGLFVLSVKMIKEPRLFISITEEQKNVLFGYTTNSSILENIFSSFAENTLIYEEFYGDDLIKIMNYTRILIHKKLDNTKLNTKEELQSGAYLNWKEETQQKYRIYTVVIQNDKLPYRIYANNIEIGLVYENEIEIDNNNVFMIRLDVSLLKEIVGKSGFTNEMYELLLEKQKHEPEEIDKIFQKEFDPFNSEYHDNKKEYNEKYFPKDEKKTFNDKLIELLNLAFSPWSGYIYHFTHLENAINIIREKKIKSRNNTESFLDSAGSSFISTTSDTIKNFARFYFRPLTPTQYYNEGLGRVTKNGDMPRCPVPIFFRFKIEEVLNKYKGGCYVSNGNLRHYPKTSFGNTYEFLKEFNFIDLYKKIEECDNQYAFLDASQQEFIIRDELDFKDINNYEIICPSKIDEKSLKNLISEEKLILDKIRVEASYYYNQNPKIKIKVEPTLLKAQIPAGVDGYLNFKFLENSENSSHVSVYSNSLLAYDTSNKTIPKANLYYCGQNEKWLIGCWKNNEKHESFTVSTDNVLLINQILSLEPKLNEIYNSKVRHYALKDHTKLVLNEFDKYFNNWDPHLPISRNAMRLFLALHDVGKPIADKNGDKNNQHLHSLDILAMLRFKINLSEVEYNYFSAMIADDPIGKWFKWEKTLEETVKKIKLSVELKKVDIQTYFGMITIYYQVDAGSYTKDAGGFQYLEHIFKYNDGQKVFDNEKKRLLFADNYEARYHELMNGLGL